MQSQQETKQANDQYPADLKELLIRASQGDTSALPNLKQAFEKYPKLAATLGDLVQHAELSLLNLIAGSNLTAREAITRQVAALRQRLLATASSELEKLLIDRIAICWIEVNYASVELAESLKKGLGASPASRAAQRRLDSAHSRYQSAIKTLATVQKLVKPPLSTLELLSRPVSETELGGDRLGRRSSKSPEQGVAVAN